MPGDDILVLLVDDQAIVAHAVKRLLAEHPDLTLVHVADPEAAVARARELNPDVILQDLVMPKADGFSLIEAYRADPQLREVPVVVLSSSENPEEKSKAFHRGAMDYVVKLPDKVEFVARLRAHARAGLYHRQRDAAMRELEVLKTELEVTNAKLLKLLAVDALTGLANRRHFDETFDLEWRRAARFASSIALVMVDVDHFKGYNDRYGHPAGDVCLRQVAGALADTVLRPGDLAARYGGEEFVLVLPSTDEAGAVTVAEACRARVRGLAIEHGGSSVANVVTISLGVAAARPDAAHAPEELLVRADAALYTAKRTRDRVVAHGLDALR
jgi:two-component system chemotaxis family response regulator WspR